LQKIPVILDTDIGVDVDDIWALVMLLKCPELDVKLIVTDTGDTTYGAKIVARLLEVANRTDIPVGVGIPLQNTPQPHAAWIDGYDLDNFPGTILEDGVGAIIDTIKASVKRVSLISIGPVPNIAAALQRQPAITKNSRFIGMHGSIYKGYMGAVKPAAEYNVAQFPKAAQKVFSTPWDITITPLDTCGLVRLKGDKFRLVRDCSDVLAQAIIENHRLWMQGFGSQLYKGLDPEIQSTVLFDTVAVYLAIAEDLLEMETLNISVDNKGYTVIDKSGQSIRCATGWKNLDAFEDLLVDRLISNQFLSGD
jgi:inosine-uridine nucleoside N-ribohydrolase